MTDFAAFDRYVESHADLYLERLKGILRIPSIAAQGKGLQEAADWVCDMAREIGLEPRQITVDDSAPFVVAQGGQGDRGLMIYNHYDVQPPEPLEEWESPPFEPTERDGRIYARGVADNKGNLVARMCAVEAYQQVIGPLPVRVQFVVEGEEEIGSKHVEAFAHAHPELFRDMNGCLWEAGYRDESGRPVISLGLRGILAVELHARTARIDAHSGNGSLYPNAAWRLVEALSTLRTPDGEITIDGFMDHVRPPTQADLELLARIPYPDELIRQRLGMKSFLGGVTGQEALRQLLFRPSCSINGIWGGYTGQGSKTVIPKEAAAKLDMRLIPDLTPDLAYDLLCAHLQRRGFDDVEVVRMEVGEMPARTPPDAPIVAAAKAVVQEVAQAEPIIFPFMAGSGPMYPLCQAFGIPAVSFGVGHAASQVHAPNENIYIQHFIDGIKAAGRFLAAVAEMPDA
ncbi:MAG: M20/M25/M40 family metallo-hydrolase [Chloroflexi bacterium]|nr:M20/M25/M40 family metallo-hydrolase [Chloroflexota bacterium]